MSASESGALGNLPTTIEAALVPSNEARIITEPDEPYRIIHVNEVWCQTCGYDAEEVLGQTCKFLHGPGTCGGTLQMLTQALQQKRGLAVQLLNYTKKGRPFMNTLQVAPLYSSSGQLTHYLGVVMARYLDGGGVVPPSVQQHSDPAGTHALGARGDESGGREQAHLGRSSNGAGCSGHGRPGDMSYCSDGGFGHDGTGHVNLSAYGGGMPGGSNSQGSSHHGMVGQVDFEAMLGMANDGSLYGGDASGANGRVPPFLTKLTEILTVEPSEVVSLNVHHAGFTIYDAQKFAKDVRCCLPPLPPGRSSSSPVLPSLSTRRGEPVASGPPGGVHLGPSPSSLCLTSPPLSPRPIL